MKKLLLIASTLLFSACFISRTPGYQSGYRFLNAENKAKINFTDPAKIVCHYNSRDSIYAINGHQLYHCIKSSMNTLVYIWSPHCHSTSCYSIKAVQDYCLRNGYTLYVVAEYYDEELFGSTAAFPEDKPLFSINEKYYKTRRCNRYYKLFVKDLLSEKSCTRDNLFSNFFLFENGELKSVSVKL